MEINQGDVFWFDAGEPRGSAPAFSIDEIVNGIKLPIEPREIEEEA